MITLSYSDDIFDNYVNTWQIELDVLGASITCRQRNNDKEVNVCGFSVVPQLLMGRYISYIRSKSSLLLPQIVENMVSSYNLKFTCEQTLQVLLINV